MDSNIPLGADCPRCGDVWSICECNSDENKEEEDNLEQ